VHTRRAARVLTVAVITISLLAPATAYAAVSRIYENRGVRTARLGQGVALAARRIGHVVLKKRDASYAGRVVWVRYFGRKRSGKYALELYSNKSGKVFAFVVNQNTYATAKGIRVGSTEAALTTAYGAILKSNPGPVYNRYTLGGRVGTDFYVRGGVVTKIVVRTF
jgi:hypothetical protein